MDWGNVNNRNGYSQVLPIVDGRGQMVNQYNQPNTQSTPQSPTSKGVYSSDSLAAQLRTWAAEPMNPPSSLRYQPPKASDFGVEIYDVANNWVSVQGIRSFSVVDASNDVVTLCWLSFARGSTPSSQNPSQPNRQAFNKQRAVQSTVSTQPPSPTPPGQPIPPTPPGHFSFYSRSSEAQRVVETAVQDYVQQQKQLVVDLERNHKDMDAAEKSGNATVIGVLFLERKRIKEKMNQIYALPDPLKSDMITVEDCIQVKYGYVRFGSNVFYVTRAIPDIADPKSATPRALVYGNSLQDNGWTAKQQALLDTVHPPTPAPSQTSTWQQPAHGDQSSPDPLDRFEPTTTNGRSPVVPSNLIAISD